MYVLVADDNLINRKVASRMLEKLDCRVDLAENGRQAAEMAAGGQYDLVFVDCQMPEMNGYEATAEIRRRETAGKHLPIIAMTASDIGARQRCLAAGMDDYLTKPLRLEDLRSTMERWRPQPAAETRPGAAGAAGGSPRKAALDQQVIEGLRMMADEEDQSFLEELFETFVTNAGAIIELLRTAAGTGDASALAKAAHNLKGSSGNIGARGMFEKCREREQLGKTASLAGSGELINDIEAGLGLVKVDLRPALFGDG